MADSAEDALGLPAGYGEFDIPLVLASKFYNEDGTLTSIHRLYVQDGEVIRAEVIDKEGIPAQNYMNDEFCGATGSERFIDLGATAAMGEAMTRGMVLTFSIWWDEGGNMVRNSRAPYSFSWYCSEAASAPEYILGGGHFPD